MKPKVMLHCATYALVNGGFLHVDRAIMPIMVPEYSPTELEEARLKRDIDAIVKRECRREKEYDDFKPVPPRKTKRKKIAGDKPRERNVGLGASKYYSKRKPKLIATSLTQA